MFKGIIALFITLQLYVTIIKYSKKLHERSTKNGNNSLKGNRNNLEKTPSFINNELRLS